MKRHLITPTRTVKLVGLVALSAIFTSTSVLAQEIIVDNRDANTSQIGNWYTSSGSYPFLGNSVYNTSSNGRFTWYPELPGNGDYDVYAWWTYHSKRSDNVPYHLYLGTTPTADFIFQVNVDQRDPDLGGRWNLLGRFSVVDSGDASISVSSENGMSSADAVKFVRVENPKAWPEASCPCDEYYSRAIDKYLAWGGSLIPPGYEGGADTVVCDDPSDTLELDAGYTTIVSNGTVTINLQAFVDYRGYADCTASVSASFLPQSEYYRVVDGFEPGWIASCRASVRDICVSD